MSQKTRVIQLYKTLLFLGRDYPTGYGPFKEKLKKSFMKNRSVTDPKELENLLDKGQYVIKEIEALYMLRKYRTLKKSLRRDVSSSSSS